MTTTDAAAREPVTPATDASPPVAVLVNIQWLRAVAASMVLLHHLRLDYSAAGGNWDSFVSVADWGFTGVDLFFVTSGFVMWHSTLRRDRGPAAAASFLRRRSLRVYLGYLPFLALMMVIRWHYQPDIFSERWIGHGILLAPHKLADRMLPISWTLTYELFFYLVFAATLFFGRRKALMFWSVFAVALLYYRFGSDGSLPGGRRVRLFWRRDLDGQWWVWWRVISSPLTLEFIGGVFLAATIEKWRSRAWLVPFAAIGVVALTWLGITNDVQRQADRPFTFGAAALLVVLMLVVLEDRGFYRASNRWVALGDASYTLYLAHIVVLALLAFVGFRTWFTEALGGIGPEVYVVAYAIAIWAFSLVYYRWVERPVYKAAVAATGSRRQ